MKNCNSKFKINKIIFSFFLFSIIYYLLSIHVSPVRAQGCLPLHKCCPDDECGLPRYETLDNTCPAGHWCCETCEAAEEGAVDLGPIGGEEGFGPWGNIANLGTEVGEAAKSFTKIISNIIGVMTIAGGIWFMFQFIAGGLGWLTAGGDKAGVQAAQKRITNAVIGLVVVVSAYALIWIIGELLGFDILHPEDLINLVGPK